MSNGSDFWEYVRDKLKLEQGKEMEQLKEYNKGARVRYLKRLLANEELDKTEKGRALKEKIRRELAE